MSRDVFVSAIIPLENDADIIADHRPRRVQVLREHYTSYELILVDDGSLDHTRQVLE